MNLHHISTTVSSMKNVIDNLFPCFTINYTDYEWICGRLILGPKNLVNSISSIMINKMNAEIHKLLSIETVVDEDQIINFPTEFLKSLAKSGFPPHELPLKKELQ